MKKEIKVGTKITFTATGDKYAISEQTSTGFQFKPIHFNKGLPTVPRTFQELKEEFLSSQIDIEGFEHNDIDDAIVELIMNGYIHQIEIELITGEKTTLQAKVDEQVVLLSQKDTAIQEKETSIEAHHGTITQLTVENDTHKQTIDAHVKNLQAKEQEIKELSGSLSYYKSETERLVAEKLEWQKQETEYQKTIAGFELMQAE